MISRKPQAIYRFFHFRPYVANPESPRPKMRGAQYATAYVCAGEVSLAAHYHFRMLAGRAVGSVFLTYASGKKNIPRDDICIGKLQRSKGINVGIAVSSVDGGSSTDAFFVPESQKITGEYYAGIRCDRCFPFAGFFYCASIKKGWLIATGRTNF